MSFGDFVAQRHAAGSLVVQPRMGLADPRLMAQGLAATKGAAAATVGTITLDSYTRLGDLASVDQALREGTELNGYPIVNLGSDVTRKMIEPIVGEDFPIQVRHGSARPRQIIEAMCGAGLHATEGGPVSYCLPYGITPLAESLREWTTACEILEGTRDADTEPHLETFGGCRMGQLCPPSLLVALSVLEALFFASHGLRSVSVSYAQQTNATQDREAVRALRTLCQELLPELEWHVVIYAYMGLYPKTADGARGLLASAAELAVDTGSERLIVKTVAEAFHLPTVADNIDALEFAAKVAMRRSHALSPVLPGQDRGEVYEEARTLIEAVLDLGQDVGRSLLTAFELGLLDVPYCLHPDNAGRARSYLDSDGYLRWARLGSLPLRRSAVGDRDEVLTASSLLTALSYVQRSFDAAALDPTARQDQLFTARGPGTLPAPSHR